MDFCLFAPQVARLQALEPGLDVDLSALTPEGHMVSQLGSYIAALFTCQPSQRPIERQILLPELARDLRPWVKAARRLRRKHRALAALEPELLGRLMSWRKRQRRLSKVRLHQAVSRAQAKNRFPAGWAVALGCLLVSCLMRFASFSPPSPSHVPDPYTRLEGIPKIRYVDPEAEEILDQMRRTQKNLDDSMRAKPGREVDVLREYLNRRLMDDSLKKVPGAKADTKAPRAGQSVSPPQKPRE
ncbi:MAG TPA: hypothetical protein VG099_20510 [Gemmataceae bacterium]|nr:hypothetical protein [Gemmataceae bacterium]